MTHGQQNALEIIDASTINVFHGSVTKLQIVPPTTVVKIPGVSQLPNYLLMADIAINGLLAT